MKLPGMMIVDIANGEPSGLSRHDNTIYDDEITTPARVNGMLPRKLSLPMKTMEAPHILRSSLLH